MNLVLQFSKSAVEKLGNSTRLRVKCSYRQGVTHVALRPSYRVSGKNAMIKMEKHKSETGSAVLSQDIITQWGLPNLKINDTGYFLEDVGYGWFLLVDGVMNQLPDSPVVKVVGEESTQYTVTNKINDVVEPTSTIQESAIPDSSLMTDIND